MTFRTPTAAEREAAFWAKVDRSGGPDACWPWLGMRSPAGYGRVKRNGVRIGANRIALGLSRGRPLTDDELALHHCDNPPCCNPGEKHLFMGTHQDNARDREAKGRGAKLTGDRHWSRLHPELMSRGPAHAAIMRAVAPRGERHWAAKLTAAQVAAIRERAKAGTAHSILAREFGVSRPAVSMLVSGATWR